MMWAVSILFQSDTWDGNKRITTNALRLRTIEAASKAEAIGLVLENIRMYGDVNGMNSAIELAIEIKTAPPESLTDKNE